MARPQGIFLTRFARTSYLLRETGSPQFIPVIWLLQELFLVFLATLHKNWFYQGQELTSQTVACVMAEQFT